MIGISARIWTAGGALAALGAMFAGSAFGTASDEVELPIIASEFEVASEMQASWGTGDIPPSSAPDIVGAFRFLCSPGQLSYDDPIVYPGEPGKSHLHQFFGNLEADAYSTYASLRKSGDSTCNNRLNRSAYWMPAMLNGQGQVIKPHHVSIYYKRIPSSSPDCVGKDDEPAMKCVGLPRGLRFIFGFDMLNMKGEKTGGGYYNCKGPGAKPGVYPDIVEAGKHCPRGSQLGAIIAAPNCWDGKNLDSTDHRGHVAYRNRGNDGKARCPDSHPYRIPTFTLAAWYDTDETLNRSGKWDPDNPGWHLSSDLMPGKKMMRPGSTFHTDWLGAWDDEVLAMWTGHCIDRMLNCSGGDLGNGKQMKLTHGYKFDGKPRIVDIPPHPLGQGAQHHHGHGIPEEKRGMQES
ncbi:MAG: DUF1996 domain-containing protein [Pseudomonadota bacterium]